MDSNTQHINTALKQQLLEHLAPFNKGVASGKNLVLEQLWDGPKALFLSQIQENSGKHLLVIGESEELHLHHDLPLFTKTPVITFPAWDTLPVESIAPSPDTVGERYEVLNKVKNEPHIILTSLTAVLQKLLLPKKFKELNLSLSVGETFSFQGLQQKLQEMGYIRSALTADKGQYAVRGGIIDIFPVNLPDAYRIEFWGDEIESMRIFDPIGQKSIRPAETFSITPATELELLSQERSMATLLDYLGKETVVVFDGLVALEDRYASLMTMMERPIKTISSFDEFFNQANNLQHLYLTEFPVEDLGNFQIDKSKALESKHPVTFSMFNRELKGLRWHHLFEPINLEKDLHDQEKDLVLLVTDENEKKSFQKNLDEQNITLSKNVRWEIGYLSSGFSIWSDPSLCILPYTELTKRHRIRRPHLRSTYHTSPSETYDLTTGEHVVHLQNGIGKFMGLEKRPNHNKVDTEYFLIQYANEAKLYVPIDQAHMVSKYVGAKEQESPRLHKLGSGRWQRTRVATEQAIMGYAAELLDSYAKRQLKGGYQYPVDSEMMRSFEDTFPYTETQDQIAAIADVKSDMLSERPTDRLVCGDVGYGKTEVALRAAFKAVVDGHKQVAVLVPTTVLALQHYENFVSRMAPFPIQVACLSRTGSAKQTKKILEGLVKGSIDVIIGTHRITSKDVHFKNLGLVIIDEEQRFGVRVKEHLKALKAGVDCLTLTATPIPRTLYMSLMGARDLSTIATPPQDRLPISTTISHSDPALIRNALLRELSRKGQSYVIHNRIETIYDYASQIQKMVPTAKIIIGHGRMNAEEMSDVFHAFKQGDADILIATSIVENGIDIPNANTIIIDRADRFGLADLYQLRGRVGRWRRKAYAYLLVPKHRMRDELVAKRLGALVEISGYGGGMQLAMRDLEIRGAGNILGTEQSGQVSAVGFHLYCKMLKRTIEALQGKLPHGFIDTKVELPIDARLPENYINEQVLRMELYQRLGDALTLEEVDTLWKELKDRFGKPPIEAKYLFHLSRIKVASARKGVSLIKWEKGSLIIEAKKGSTTVKKRLPFSLPKTPFELEKQLLAKLKSV